MSFTLMIICAHKLNDDYYKACGNVSAANDEKFMQQKNFCHNFQVNC